MSSMMDEMPKGQQPKEWLTAMYQTLKEIAEARDGVCRHVNAARRVLGMKEWEENMIDPEPCEHEYVEAKKTTIDCGGFWHGEIHTDEVDFLYCKHCGDCIQPVPEYIDDYAEMDT